MSVNNSCSLAIDPLIEFLSSSCSISAALFVARRVCLGSVSSDALLSVHLKVSYLTNAYHTFYLNSVLNLQAYAKNKNSIDS